MSYFNELPNLEYFSPLNTKGSGREYITVKNLFRRVKLFDWIQEYSNVFQKIELNEFDRPDIIAEEYYGSASYDWVVLITADITNYQQQWPLSNQDLYDFTVEKYGLEEINEIHHYETLEVRDNNGKLILPRGQIVDSNFTINPPDGVHSKFYKVIGTYNDISTITDFQNKLGTEIINGISNYEYETDVNESKRLISILRPNYLQQFLNDMRTLMSYKKSSEYIDSKTSRVNRNQSI